MARRDDDVRRRDGEGGRGGRSWDRGRVGAERKGDGGGMHRSRKSLDGHMLLAVRINAPTDPTSSDWQEPRSWCSQTSRTSPGR